MSGIEMALINVGRAVVTPLFTRWLSNRQAQSERTLPLAELLRNSATDEFSRRRGERQIESLVDDVAERLRPLLTTRFASLSSHETTAALEAVADTLRRADLSDHALFSIDLDPDRFADHLRRSEPPADLSDLASHLYVLVLEDCARCFMQLVVKSKPFADRAAVVTLERLSAIAALMSTMLRTFEPTWLPPAEFATKYTEALTNKLNVLELVGVETSYRPQTRLNVAYISLSASGDSTGPGGSSPWEPGMIRHAGNGGDSERIEQALARGRRILIRGEAGGGKSTLLRWLAVTAASHGFAGPLAAWNSRVPFLIKLRSWPERLPAPEQFLTDVADNIVGTMPPGWVHRQLANGQGLLLVDGVDEVPAERRPAVRTWLRDLLDVYPESLMVVTSRPPAAPVRWLEAEGFESLALERLAPADVRALIDQWHRAAITTPSWPPFERSKYEQSLLTQLAANRHLCRLAGNPLMAAMLCALNLGRETHLPVDRMGIYAAAVDMLLHRRDTERGVTSTVPGMTVPEQLQLLQDLSWRLSLNGRAELSRAEAVEHVKRRLTGMRRVTAPAEQVLTHLVERSGILREPAADRVDFVHRTFQEYLAAREAAEQSMGGMLAGQAHLDAWREIVIMAAGHGNSPMRTELIEGILRRADQEPRHHRSLIVLAAACRETMPSLEPPDLLDDIDRRLDTLLPPRNRAEARSLYTVGDPLLDRLPNTPAGLTPKQAAAVIHTMALVNGPRALGLLAGFAKDGRDEVQDALIQVWRYFDPQQYAERVLRDVPKRVDPLWISEPTLLRHTANLPQLTEFRLDCQSTVDLASLGRNPRLTRLNLRRGWKGPTRVLTRFPALRALMLVTDRPITVPDVLPLTELAELRWLWLQGDGIQQEVIDVLLLAKKLTVVHVATKEGTDLSALAGWSSLRMMGLIGPDAGSLRGLPATELPGLSLGHLRSAPDNDVKALTRLFPKLTELQLYGLRWPMSLDIAGEFPQLEHLSLDHAMATRINSLRAPAGLRQVDIGFVAELDVTPLARLPQLRHIVLRWVDRPIDLSPFAAWAGGELTIETTRGQRLTHRDTLPRTIRIERTEPKDFSFA